MEKETQMYEIGYFLNSGLKDEEVKSFIETVRNAISEKGGLILSEGSPKNTLLGYPIKKETSGIFNWIKFLTRPELIKDIRERLNKETVILRFSVVKSNEESTMLKKTRSRISLSGQTGSTTSGHKIKSEKEQLAVTSVTDEEKATTIHSDSEPKRTKDESRRMSLPVQEEELDKKIEEILGGDK